MQKKSFYLPINGELIVVTKEVYKEFYRLKRRERYLYERDTEEGLLYLSNYDTEEFNVIDAIEDKSVNVEKLVETGIMIKELNKALEKLTLTRK